MAWQDIADPSWPSRVCATCGQSAYNCVCALGPPSEPVPQLQGERIAFREWQVGEDLGLYSTGVGERWEREMVADSSRCTEVEYNAWQSKHPASRTEVRAHEGSPHPDCPSCGLHAFYEVSKTFNYAPEESGLVGAIVVSGRTMLGPTGVRAEKARVVLLAYANDRQKVLADAASRKLGVGCCALADLERLALEYGQPVPDDEKPEQEGFAAGGLIQNWSNAPIVIANNTMLSGGNAVALSGGGSTAIKNLSVGVPQGRSVEVDGSTGEVAVRVDGQEWTRKRARRSGWIAWWTFYGTVEAAFGIAMTAHAGLSALTPLYVGCVLLSLWMLVLNFREEAK